ncbi:MAG: SsrA-binding protein [Deltaproteobacteria bacterium]|nr:SsrA-binding protein SmpB [Deltaproteobacteria bacterium]RLA90437.1 MAG: SsrA-binding protein [Deltaproteobacteria bacterium]
MVDKLICQNKKAWHDYFITETYEAGISLTGSEVKSLREGRVNLSDGYVKVKRDEAYLYNVHISPYSKARKEDQDPRRIRKLLLHKREIRKISSKMDERGMTVIPLNLYFSKGKAKVEIGLAKGKKKYDKREAIKRKTMERELARGLKYKKFKK